MPSLESDQGQGDRADELGDRSERYDADDGVSQAHSEELEGRLHDRSS
ncbi:hypothetical protein ES705_27593 [subsurface metagenome]